MGEPGGIGPEVIVKAISRDDVRNTCNPVVIGNIDVIKKAAELTDIRMEVREVSSPSTSIDKDVIGVIDTGTQVSVEPQSSSYSGKAVVEYIKKAVGFALRAEADAIVTAPISKESLRMAGHPWPGHTEMLAELTDTKDFAMMIVGGALRVILCTIHIPLREVAGRINESIVFRTILLAERGMDMLGMRRARIGVAGLNPHAGEGGLLGREDMEMIAPAIKMARAEGIDVSGPYPPDVIFHRACRGDFDIIVAMYHDQGLIPFKMLEFHRGVNVTVGLPIIRTSPDHGVGFDIAWRNMADPSSMIEAIELATRLRLTHNM